MKLIQFFLPLISVFLFSGCHLLLVGATGMPGWSCIHARGPIALCEELSVSGENVQLATPAGSVAAGEGAKIIARHKDARGRTTHFRVRTQDGTTGWFPWQGNDFSGSSGTKCW